MTATQLLSRNLDWPDCSSSPQQKIAASHQWKMSFSGSDGAFIVTAVKSEPEGVFHREQTQSPERTAFADYYWDRVLAAFAVKQDPPKTVGELESGSTDPFYPWFQPHELDFNSPPETNPAAGFETATSADPVTGVFILSDWHYYFQTLAIHRLLQEQEEAQDRQRLWDRLDTSFAHEDLEPDRDHPAERTLGQALFNPRARRWLVGFCADEGHPELAASLLLCLCRLPALYLVEWEEQLIIRALACDDMEIRDAAVQLAAAWGGDHLQGLLQSHQDSEDWLQDYIGSVLEDWSI